MSPSGGGVCKLVGGKGEDFYPPLAGQGEAIPRWRGQGVEIPPFTNQLNFLYYITDITIFF